MRQLKILSKLEKNSMGHPVTKPMRMIETENLSENMNISESIPDQIKDSIAVGTNSMGHPITGAVVIGIMGQSTEGEKYKNKLFHERKNPFQCQFCHYRFSQKETLNKHLES